MWFIVVYLMFQKSLVQKIASLIKISLARKKEKYIDIGYFQLVQRGESLANGLSHNRYEHGCSNCVIYPFF